jgi:hypothetical protein
MNFDCMLDCNSEHSTQVQEGRLGPAEYSSVHPTHVPLKPEPRYLTHLASSSAILLLIADSSRRCLGICSSPHSPPHAPGAFLVSHATAKPRQHVQEEASNTVLCSPGTVSQQAQPAQQAQSAIAGTAHAAGTARTRVYSGTDSSEAATTQLSSRATLDEEHIPQLRASSQRCSSEPAAAQTSPDIVRDKFQYGTAARAASCHHLLDPPPVRASTRMLTTRTSQTHQ